MIKFKNDSEIQTTNISNGNIRGKRVELIGFYCKGCDCIHIDYPIKNIIILYDNVYCNKVLEL